MKESLDFYDKFDSKLINDYTKGNRRIQSAIVNLAKYIPEGSKRVLDIGCGLGWSSYEFSKHFDKAQVTGIDLSPVLVETASKLFQNKNLNYSVFDVTQSLPEGDKYDAIIMIDVYEHIPVANRSDFHNGLKNLLAEQGRLILACPSKYHQDYLRKHKPEGLQPVDEDVDFTTISDVAKDLDGEVVFYEYQKIWDTFDYLYAVIERTPIYSSDYGIASKNPLTLEPKASRYERVKSKLGLEIEIPQPQTTLKTPQTSKGKTSILAKIMRRLRS
ncbi:class I SAM-dependent methyltransferase [Aureisphaera galaxeae]|uniref:class I SAM-dependent methyltransferase n=1 Tax=Aureisphaera galaxeae TaxID=1538023 RepID=UPI0023501098|nr:class I SAM-dependent methyltransferase [Aureisphaera galaxeae]MDC8006281.1 class I SAM-dependent methyltransferase [Aureisphaera galaxeae]